LDLREPSYNGRKGREGRKKKGEKGGERKGIGREQERSGREGEGKGTCLLLNLGLAMPLMQLFNSVNFALHQQVQDVNKENEI